MRTFTDWILQQVSREDSIGVIARRMAGVLDEHPQFSGHGAGHWLAILWHDGHSVEERAVLETAVDEYNLIKYGYSKTKR
jgi:hypothetical protein